jgi:F-type H+-transporting ATPase subunit delta
MQNPRLAGRYAKSLIDLSNERNQLETSYNDMKLLQRIFKSNRDFVNLLKSPVIKAETKDKIITAVLKGQLNELTDAFIHLLVRKGRESNLPEIANAFIDQYNAMKGIHKVKLTTATPVSDDVKNAMISKINKEAGFDKIEMETSVDDSLIGGFVLEFDNNLVDASILRDLKDIQKQFAENVYVQNIR